MSQVLKERMRNAFPRPDGTGNPTRLIMVQSMQAHDLRQRVPRQHVVWAPRPKLYTSNDLATHVFLHLIFYEEEEDEWWALIVLVVNGDMLFLPNFY